MFVYCQIQRGICGHSGIFIAMRTALLNSFCYRFTAADPKLSVGGHHVEKSRSTNGEGGDTTIPFPGRSPKQPLPGIGLHDPLHGRQAYPEFNSFHPGVGRIFLREGLVSCRPLPKRDKSVTSPPPPQSLNDSKCRYKYTPYVHS